MSAPPPPYSAVDDTSKYPAPASQPYPTQPAYAPQPPVMAQPAVQGQQSTVVVTTAPTYVTGVLGEAPVQTTCTNCQRAVLTSLSYETGGLTWLIFAVLCFVGCWICAFIPFCVDDCKDVIHTCPNCGFVLGCHRRL